MCCTHVGTAADLVRFGALRIGIADEPVNVSLRPLLL